MVPPPFHVPWLQSGYNEPGGNSTTRVDNIPPMCQIQNLSLWPMNCLMLQKKDMDFQHILNKESCWSFSQREMMAKWILCHGMVVLEFVPLVTLEGNGCCRSSKLFLPIFVQTKICWPDFQPVVVDLQSLFAITFVTDITRKKGVPVPRVTSRKQHQSNSDAGKELVMIPPYATPFYCFSWVQMLFFLRGLSILSSVQAGLHELSKPLLLQSARKRMEHQRISICSFLMKPWMFMIVV